MIEPVDIVERKLSGVYQRREIQIPYAWFENYVKNMVSMLSNNGVIKDHSEIANNQLVISTFEKDLDRWMADITIDLSDCIGDPWSLAGNMFATEIEAKQQEQSELMKKAMAAAKDDDELAKAIPVRPRHRSKAIEILKQAGIFDEFFASHIEKRLNDIYGPKDSEF
jgi:hypothetical protein